MLGRTEIEQTGGLPDERSLKMQIIPQGEEDFTLPELYLSVRKEVILEHTDWETFPIKGSPPKDGGKKPS